MRVSKQCCFLMVLQCSAAVDIFVSHSGHDSPACGSNESLACGSINAAAVQVRDGDRVLIQRSPQPYSCAAPFGSIVSTSVSFQSYGGEALDFATMDCASLSRAFLITSGGDKNVSFSGIAFKGGLADVGGAISAQLEQGIVQLEVGNCVFSANRAHLEGGAIFGNSSAPGGNINIANCSFSENIAFKSGGAVAWRQRTPTRQLVAISDSFFLNNVSPHSDEYQLSWGGAVRVDVRGGGIDVQDSQFCNNSADVGGGLVLQSKARQSNIRVKNSVFKDNWSSSGRSSQGFPGSIMMVVWPDADEVYSEITGCSIGSDPSLDSAVNVYNYASNATVVIQDSAFTNNTGMPFNVETDSEDGCSQCILSNVLNTSVVIRRSNFSGNSGSLSITNPKDSPSKYGYYSRTELTDVVIEKGTGARLTNGVLSLLRVTITNNTMTQSHVGALSVDGSASLSMTDCILRGGSFGGGASLLNVNSMGPLNLSNVQTLVHASMQPAFFNLNSIQANTSSPEPNVTFSSCPQGFDIRIQQFHYVIYHIHYLSRTSSCVPCPPGSYSLMHGFIAGEDVSHISCLPCPIGGSCSRGGALISALPGFFGVGSVSSTMVAFSRCRPGLCLASLGGSEVVSQRDISFTAVAKCAHGRTGVLCGECLDGFSPSTGASCLKDEECTGWKWMVPVGLLLVLLYVSYLSFFVSPTSPGTFRLVVYFYQMASLVTLPQSSATRLVLQVLGFNPLATLSVGGGSFITCFLPKTSAISLAFAGYLWPFVFTLFIFILRRCRTSSRGSFGSSVLKVFLLTFSSSSKTSFDLLTCIDIPSLNRTVLLIDPVVECYPVWAVIPFLVVSMQVFLLGSCIVLLQSSPLRQLPSLPALHVLRSRLMAPFTSNAHWWEVLLLAQVFLFNTVRAFVLSPAAAASILILIALLCLLAHTLTAPFRDLVVNHVQTILLFTLCVLALATMPQGVLDSAVTTRDLPGSIVFETVQGLCLCVPFVVVLWALWRRYRSNGKTAVDLEPQSFQGLLSDQQSDPGLLEDHRGSLQWQ